MQAQSNSSRSSPAIAVGRLFGSLALLAPLSVFAAAPAQHSFAAPVQFAGGSTGFGMLRVCLALVLVLASVYAVAWLMRRLRGASGASSPGMVIVSQVSLGARERAVLLRIGERQLLLGVAAGSVRLLQELTLATPPEVASATGAAPATGSAQPNFRELLRRSLGR